LHGFVEAALSPARGSREAVQTLVRDTMAAVPAALETLLAQRNWHELSAV
jgi:hypothetical protein